MELERDRAERLAVVEAVTKAFDDHDLDGIMAHIAADAVFDSPRGANPWGTRVTGADAIREAFAARFSGIPDVRYGDASHFVDGDRGASEWTLSGMTTDGQRIEVRGCDLWTFRGSEIVKKDSFWKIRVEP